MMHRVALAVVLGIAALGTACAKEPSAKAAAAPAANRAADGSDWPCFLGPTGDSKSTETGILTKWPADGPPLVWTLKLGTGYGMPTIAAGRLYQFDRADDEARLRCVDRRTGKLHWEFKYPTAFEDLYGYDNGPRCSPVLDDDRVYIFGAEGMLHCLRADDGKVVWKIDTAEKFGVIQNFFGVGSTPVVEGDLLIVQIGGSPPESKSVPPGRLDLVEGNGSGIVAFDKRTGEVRYKSPTSWPATRAPNWPRSTAGDGASSLLVADWSALSPRAARSTSSFPGGRGFWKASTPASRSSWTTWC